MSTAIHETTLPAELERTQPDAAFVLRYVERIAARAFITCAVIMSVIFGATLLLGLDPRSELVFWVGAIIGFVGIALLGIAAVRMPTHDWRAVRRMRWLTRLGIVLFIAAPVLCGSALFGGAP